MSSWRNPTPVVPYNFDPRLLPILTPGRDGVKTFFGPPEGLGSGGAAAGDG